MTSFSPIAIVGRGCILPGALDPESLWERIRRGDDLTSASTREAWGLDPARVCADPIEPSFSARGGYVEGFGEVWDPSGFLRPPEELDSLPAGWKWLLAAGRQALHEAGLPSLHGARSAFVLGSLGYPTREFAELAARRWLALPTSSDPRALEGQTGAARWAARAWGVQGPAFAVDAACASGLYALKLACDALQERRVDLALAGGLNAADDLFLHIGFSALAALSRSGRSSPLSARADGLLPAEGAAVLVLRRLEDALASGDRVVAVIRGIGLSNDGRGPGLLAPASEGQLRAVQGAWRGGGLDPATLDYLECHATGTPVGDGEELRTLLSLLGPEHPLRLGSLKAQLGHLITASATAGILKLCASLEHDLMPPGPRGALAEPLPLLEESSFRLEAETVSWEPTGTRARRAGINAFGFGGCNAHAILEGPEGAEELLPTAPPAGAIAPEAKGKKRAVKGAPTAPPLELATPPLELALLAFEGSVGGGDGRELLRQWARVTPPGHRIRELPLELRGLGFPPADLRQTLPQQLLLLQAAQRLRPALAGIPREELGIFIGTDIDPASARHGCRWRLDRYLERPARESERDAVIGALQAAGVLGTMPNMPANRLNSLLDAAGPGMVLSEGEESGLRALDLAAGALSRGEIGAALVGSVDASGGAFGDDPDRADSVVLLLLVPADRVGDREVLARLTRLAPEEVPAPDSTTSDSLPSGVAGVGAQGVPMAPWGSSLPWRVEGATRGLLELLVGALSTRYGLLPSNPSLPWVAPKRVLTGHGWQIEGGGESLGLSEELPRMVRISAPTLPELAVRVGEGTGVSAQAAVGGESEEGGPDPEGKEGVWRVVGLGSPPAGLADLLTRVEGVREGDPPRQLLPGWWLAGGRGEGEVAWVFTGAAAAYPSAGRDLLLALPGLGAALAERAPKLSALLPRLLDGGPLSLVEQLQLATLLSQAHALLLRQLGVEADACLGLSSGETNSFLASGAWSDPDGLFEALRDSEMYERYLGGEYQTLREAWEVSPTDPLPVWRCYRVRHPVAKIREAIAAWPGDRPVRLLIVHHEGDAVIGGEEEGVRHFIAALGAGATPLHHDLLVHAPELDPFAEVWYRVHHRETVSITRPRLYANALHGSFVPTSDRCAEVLTVQARDTVVFDATVEQAWADGVRTFIEVGPRGACSGWIGEILGERPHLAVPLDGSRGGVRGVAEALLPLVAAGGGEVLSRWETLLDRIRPWWGPSSSEATTMVTLPGHLPIPPRMALATNTLRFPPPPNLHPVLEDRLRPVEGASSSSSSLLLTASQPPQPEPLARPMATPPEAPHPPAPLHSSAVSHPAAVPHLPAALRALAETQSALLRVQGMTVAQLSAPPLRSTAPARALVPPSAPVESPAPTLAAPSPPRDAGLPAPDRVSVQVGPSTAVAPPSALEATRSSEASPTAPQLDQDQGTPPVGPSFTRAQLEVLSGGSISSVFGPAFVAQDEYHRQVRMPMPPLLLADRVLGIEGEPTSMGIGKIWTETDVREDSWYLHQGRMPTGILIESGQADLLLISWLGVDLQNRGERIYRLLGCETTFHGRPPTAGETLRYEIAIDGHARHGDVGLFFFHYECRSNGLPRLTVREGQAGFFTDEELAESAGVLWDPQEDLPEPGLPLDPPVRGILPAVTYSADRVAACAAGRMVEAFGPEFLRTESHTRTPRIPAERMQLFERVEELRLDGGPWGRGYMRAVLPISPDSWFFAGHFLNDPCMPGTLMFEGCLQTMAFYLLAQGYGIDRDGWIFEPVPELPYKMRCRGQVTPQSKELVYELFVTELRGGEEPLLVADILCTVDGLKAFHCRRMAIRLSPDYPLGPSQLAAIPEDRGEVAVVNGFRYGQASLLACANGDPLAAFGELYASIPSTRRVPRLPAPPYHFMSRITRLSDPPGVMRSGAEVESEYDLPPEAWYFHAHPSGEMPVCVLLEAALQPCGWLASYVGCAVQEEELFFRNLDGKGRLHRPIRADDGTLHVHSRLRSLSKAGGMILVSFDVECRVGEELVYELDTTFGFFPGAALAGQAGLPASEEEIAFASTSAELDLTQTLQGLAAEALPLAPLRMVDRVTHRILDEAGGARLRGEKEVQSGEWFLRAHFYQDPVQPGSLGVEALVQLLQAHLLLEGAAETLVGGHFEDFTGTDPVVWQFRGQVLPEASRVSLTLEAEPIRRSEGEWRVRAEGSVWVDGRRIYSVRGIEVAWSMALRPSSGDGQPHELRRVWDPALQPWWGDHRPTYTLPVAPGMALLSLALDFPQRGGRGRVGRVEELQLRRWVVLDRAKEIVAREESDGRVRFLERSPQGEELLLAEGVVHRSRSGEASVGGSIAVSPLPAGAAPFEDPYASGSLFHGPSYQWVVSGRSSPEGVDLEIEIPAASGTGERISHILLDVGLHGVPHDAMERWFPEVAVGQVAYPSRVERFDLLGPVPTSGRCQVRIRPLGLDGGSKRNPKVLVQYLAEGELWAELVLVEICLPATRLGAIPGVQRRAFLRDGAFVPGVRLSEEVDGVTRLTVRTVSQADWLPGTVAALYGLGGEESSGEARVRSIAAREHAAQRLVLHPREVQVDAEGRVQAAALPLIDYTLAITSDAQGVQVRDRASSRMSVDAVERWWRDRGWESRWPDLRPLFMEACRRFVAGVRLVDPAALRSVADRPFLLLANHQVGIESALAGVVLPPVLGRPLLVLAKEEHRASWVGRLAVGLNDARHGDPILHVDRDRQEDMLDKLRLMAEAARSGVRSLLVHVEGTRSVRGGQPVTTLSAVWTDLAVREGLTILPLRFCRGLPAAGVASRLEFPFGMGRQEFVIGRPIPGEELERAPLDARRARVLEGLAELEAYDGDPYPDPDMGERVRAAMARWNLDEVRAVFRLLLGEAQGEMLDAEGLPKEEVPEGIEGAFWNWFLDRSGVPAT